LKLTPIWHPDGRGREWHASAKRDRAAITSAKGGSFWTRVRHNAHWLAIGAGVDAAAVCASGHCR
jgi:hypothetical protein